MDEFISFDEFLKRTDGTSAGSPQMAGVVASETEFDRMRDGLLALYKDLKVTHSYVNTEGQYIDCIPIDEQPSLRRPDGTFEKVATPPQSILLPAGAPSLMPTPTPLTDNFGNLQRCPDGTIPKRRITLEEMSRFYTLEDFFRKQLPPKMSPSAAVALESHYYAYAEQMVDNFGGSSVLNLWAPVPTTNNFSLSQQWYTGGTGAGSQTIEAGWQVYPSKYNTTKPCLFIFWTPNNYDNSGPGSYNLDKAGFVQTDPTWVLGGAFPSTSVKGGVQFEVIIQWLRDLVYGNWWLYVGYPPNPLTPVGYYPRTLFGSGQLASNAQYIKYGGEVTGSPPPGNTASGEMGSGELSSMGYLKAAYQRAIYYIPFNGIPTTALLTGHNTQTYYTTSLTNNSGDPNWGTYFFFGGQSHP